MKLSILSFALIFTGVALAAPNPDPEAEASFDLEKRSCDDLTHRQCHYENHDGGKSGVYCGWCPEVQGNAWRANHAYQLNHRDGSCCSYGYRESCDNVNGNKQCPI